MTHRQTLSKSERLKSYKRIRILFEQGQKFKVFPFVVYFMQRVEHVGERLGAVEPGPQPGLGKTGRRGLESLNLVDGTLQMGVSVGKRHFKRAVDRNLLKRRIREAYRKQNNELKETLLASGYALDVFFVYANARISDYAEIASGMTNAMTMLCDKIPAK